MKSFISNKVTEKDIRDWLSENGFKGKSATFTEIELHAIQRPGWLQIFRFDCSVRVAENRNTHLFGALRSDERYGPPKIFVCEDLDSRDSQLVEWSRGLLTLRKNRKHQD